jgi:hypothetical protein
MGVFKIQELWKLFLIVGFRYRLRIGKRKLMI